MEPPTGFWASIWSFVCFLPFFIGLWLLGNIKGVIFCPVVCLIMTIGNSAIIDGLWPVHCIWTYYCVVRSKKLGPSLKLVTCTCLLPLVLILWPVVGIVGSVIGGAAYGFLSPIFATFEAVEGGKGNKLFHCFIDGTWTTIAKTFDIIKDVKNECYDTYFSVMDDLLQPKLPDGKYYEIRLGYLPGAIVAAVLGVIVDVPVISVVSIIKGPYMLFKGWNRLLHDLIGREGPFLETICVPFAGLAIILWPLAVVSAVLASVLASFFLGAYAGLVSYQESSFLFGLGYIVAVVSLYDEYSNDVLDMRDGSCFPRPQYRKNTELKPIPRTASLSHSNSLTKTRSLAKTLSRALSMKDNIAELKPFELLDGLFKECHQLGESLVSAGLITHQDLQEAKSERGGRVIRIGLPAYCLLQALLRSAKVGSSGILLSDGTEITTSNRPKEQFFEWFLNPLLIIKEQIKSENLCLLEEDYFGKLVLYNGDPNRVKDFIGHVPESDRKRAELDALARRLQGITKFITRFPTYKRRFDVILNTLSDELSEKHGASKIITSKSAFPRLISLKSFKYHASKPNDSGEESEHTRDLEISS
ncbi:hypothetical protein VNO78_33559 [Psophocarpus tetragonolobus]|uniref:Uncharacterized protein n=1 Tax=Psophocarpus tetragonolobus TaxID=3891 RepID=A0AAN9RLG0_PSOTE